MGRDAEFRALQEAVARLREGIGGIVTVVGEAGIGKSRMLAEFAAWLEAHLSLAQRQAAVAQLAGILALQPQLPSRTQGRRLSDYMLFRLLPAEWRVFLWLRHCKLTY